MKIIVSILFKVLYEKTPPRKSRIDMPEKHRSYSKRLGIVEPVFGGT
ncbi:MAG: hypothetical protein ABIJ52_18295 [Pseudomonadota bacterium]